MNLVRTNLFAGCALGLLLVSGAGCGDALEHEPSETTDNLDTSDPVPGAVAANPVAGAVSANRNPGEPSCAINPVKPIPGIPRPPLPSAGTEPVMACSGGTIGDAPCAGAPKPVKPGAGIPSAGARKCTSLAIGGNVCVPYTDIKLKAADLCEAQGLQLTDLKLGSEDCSGGTSQSWASCCAPEPPRPANTCSGGVIGDGRTCLDLAAIKLKASAACEESGSTLVELAGAGDASCPNGALQAKFACACSEPGKYDPRPIGNGAMPPPVAGKEPWLN